MNPRHTQAGTFASSGTRSPVENGAMDTPPKVTITDYGGSDDVLSPSENAMHMTKSDSSVNSANGTIAIQMAKPKRLPLTELLTQLKSYIEDRSDRSVDKIIITGDVDRCNIDLEYLKGNHYKFHNYGNLKFWHRLYSFELFGDMHHNIYIGNNSVRKPEILGALPTSKWELIISPNVVVKEKDLSRMMDLASSICNTAFKGFHTFNIKVMDLECSLALSCLTPEGNEVMKWFRDNNCTLLKFYPHDNTEARGEISYREPALAPTTGRILSEW